MQVDLAILRDESQPEPLAEVMLVQQARDDPSLFTPLYNLYRDRIYWYLRARVSSDEDAADLTQQVFLRALERLHQYQERKGPFAAWLFAIARHAASNSHRRPRSVDCGLQADPNGAPSGLASYATGPFSIGIVRHLFFAYEGYVGQNHPASLDGGQVTGHETLDGVPVDVVKDSAGNILYFDAQSYVLRGVDWFPNHDGASSRSSWHARLLQYGTVPASAVPSAPGEVIEPYRHPRCNHHRHLPDLSRRWASVART
jgi:Sigma-70 region 2